MCDARPQDRQTNAEIHRPQAGQQLQGDVSLIVIHGHDAIKRAAAGTYKQGIAGQRSRSLDSLRLRRGHSRLDDRRFLISEESAVASMRVQGRYANLRPPAEQVAHHAIEQADLVKHRLGRQVTKNIAECQMQRHMDHSQAMPIKHHRKAMRPGALREDFGMARIAKARCSQSFFVQRSGHDASRLAGQRSIDGGTEIIVSRPPGRGTDTAGDDLAHILLAASQTGNDLASRF